MELQLFTPVCSCANMLFLLSNYVPGKEKHFFAVIIQNIFIYKQPIFIGTVRTHCKTVFCSSLIDKTLIWDVTLYLSSINQQNQYLLCAQRISSLNIKVDTQTVSGMKTYLCWFRFVFLGLFAYGK